jgi:hypothetical protein
MSVHVFWGDGQPLQRRALGPLPPRCVAARQPAARLVLKWLVASAHEYIQLYDSLAGWSVVIARRICPRLVVPWNPRRALWHRLYTHALDVIWTRRASLCDVLNRACLVALERVREIVRTAKKLRTPVLSPFAGRLHTTLLDWAHVEHRACLLRQVALAHWRECLIWRACFSYEVQPRTRSRAMEREDFVQLAWLRALQGVFDALKTRRLRTYDQLGLALARSRKDAAGHWQTIKTLTRVDTMD